MRPLELKTTKKIRMLEIRLFNTDIMLGTGKKRSQNAAPEAIAEVTYL